MGFEPTIPAFEKTKTVHALYRSATVAGQLYLRLRLIHSLGDVLLGHVVASV
jgi:hypothetical protein